MDDHARLRSVAVDLGLGAHVPAGADIDVLTADSIRGMLPARPLAGHKGTFGHAVIVGGSEQYRGAPALAGRAAARAGAGTVAIAAPATITDSIAPIAPEATHIPLAFETGDHEARAADQIIASFLTKRPDALCMGPGLGRQSGRDAFVSALLQQLPQDLPLLVDADALNVLAEQGDWWTLLNTVSVITPHPGEMAGLCGVGVAKVQANRVEIASEMAEQWRVTIVLKGAYTVIASPARPPSICPLAFPALASGGTGDALAGIITACLAQGLTPHDAASVGVYVHGTAAALAAQDNGNMHSGLLASDLIEKIPAAMALIERGDGPVEPMLA